MTINEWAGKLGIDLFRSRSAEDFWTICPCHSDTQPSLHVWVEKNGRIVMHCFLCGAKGVDVCNTLNIEKEELRGYPIRTRTDGPENCWTCRYREAARDTYCELWECGKHVRRYNLTYNAAKGLRCAEYEPRIARIKPWISKPEIRVSWGRALDVAACAVCDKVDELTGNRQTASDELIHALVECFADRVASMVSNKIDRELAESTPPIEPPEEK